MGTYRSNVATVQGDRVLGVPQDESESITTKLRNGKRRDGRRTVRPWRYPLPTDHLAWDVFNHMTDHVRTEQVYHCRVALEGLGGDILKAFDRGMATRGAQWFHSMRSSTRYWLK
jgi:hypothetical protein